MLLYTHTKRITQNKVMARGDQKDAREYKRAVYERGIFVDTEYRV